eukprot:s832_g13.t1
MRSELDGHLGIGSLTKHVGKEARSLVNTPGAEVLPALAVYTAKPPKVGSKKAFRRKCRAVACGNFTEITSEENTYSAGAQAEAVRIALAIASSETWSAYVTDISQAFLRAPLPDLERLILLKPPAHFIQAGICDPTEIWRAHRAVYGLREAPKWWSDHRDQVLRQASWVSEGQTMHLEQLEGSVWLVKDEEGQRRGVMVVYVDDCLVLSTQGQAQSFHAFLNQVWETSPLEGCQEVGDMVQFLGMNITKTRFGFSLGQQPYLNDLMAKYQVESQSPQMAPRDWVKEEPEQQEYEVAELRRAQSICGELLWVSQRTRPDISHTTALLASWTTRDPSLVYKLGLRMLQYLHGTLEYQLVLEAVQGDPLLQCFTDASFAPFGSRSYSGIAIKFQGCLVMWRATKQSLVSGTSLTIDLLVDNTSALQLLQGRGANRTRHLRIRSNFVKERVEAREVSLHHIPGERQEADLFTKVLPGPRLKFLRGLVGLQTSSEDQEYPVAQAASVQQGGLDNLQSWLLFLLSCLQMYTAGGQGEEPTRLEVEPPYELMLLTALVVLSVIALWEGGRGLVGCCATRVRPRVRSPPYELMLLTALVVLSVIALWEGGRGLVGCCATRVRPRVRSVRTTKGKSVEERVQEAIKKELDGERLRQERGLVSRGKAASAIRDAGSAASQSDSSRAAAPSSVKDVPSPPARHVPPPPVNTYRGRASSASQTDAGSAVRMQDRGSQTEALAHALMSNTTLKVLRLEDNAVGDLGAAALVSGAGRLHELELAFNQVRAEGAVAVAAALRSHGALRRLGLQGNELRDAGASALAAAISKNCGLQELSLRSSGVGSAGGSALVQALRGNWRLTALDVTENAVTQEAATSIAEMTRQARLVQEEALRAPTIRELTEGTVRRFPTEWSVRAWLGWLSQDARETDVKTMVAVSHAAAVMSSDSDVLSYDLARLRDLASIYGRRLAPGGRLKEAAKGVFLLNLTPFCIQATVGKGSKAVQLKENSGMHLGSDATTIRLALSLSKDSPVWLPQTLPQVVVTPVAGEQSVELPDAEHLRVLSSRWRAEESSHAQLITLLWSWPHRLRGIRFHDLSFWWQGARGAMQGEATDMKSAITRVVLPDTALAQCSLAELYTPGPVQTFVSHHWGQDVDELFKSLSHCSMCAENTRLWICAFSNNHWSPARDEDRLSLSGDALTSRSCHSFVMILGTEAQSLCRLWCLHEALLATQVRGSGRPMVLKLCSPHGLLSEGTGGMPISYILKVSSAISTLDLQIAQCDSAAEKDMLLDAVQRLAGSISAANLRCRQFLQDGLSVMHQRGQQIFVQAVSWLNGTKLSAKEDDAGYSPEQCAVTGDPADSPEPLPASSEEQSRASSKASSPGEEEEEQPACLAERQEESEEVEDEQPAGLADRQEESEESEAALEAPVVSVDRRTSKESTSWQTEDDRRSSEGTDAEADVADAGTEASYEEVRQTQSCESEVEAASGTVESGRPEEGSSRPSSPREGPGSSPPESDESDREGEERQETESEEDSEPPRKRKAPAVDNQDVERSFSESSGSLEDDSEREGSRPDELSQAAPVEVTVVRAPAKEEDDPGTDRGHAGLQQLAPASVPVNGPASPFFRPFPGPDQGDLDTPMPSDADLDDADPCKSPSLTPSFSPEPDAISCHQAASGVKLTPHGTSTETLCGKSCFRCGYA